MVCSLAGAAEPKDEKSDDATLATVRFYLLNVNGKGSGFVLIVLFKQKLFSLLTSVCLLIIHAI